MMLNKTTIHLEHFEFDLSFTAKLINNVLVLKWKIKIYVLYIFIVGDHLSHRSLYEFQRYHSG
uniref:Uncharacterized protein n=1 Tax=Parascaris univalens TaxID=6257 RepID=A0A914ZKZ2_PARUN